MSNLPQYIYRNTSNRLPYMVLKRLGGITICFGYYSTVVEAVAARDQLIANRWAR
jgi:hypothetical protein